VNNQLLRRPPRNSPTNKRAHERRQILFLVLPPNPSIGKAYRRQWTADSFHKFPNLPPELRTNVYAEALTFSEPVLIRTDNTRDNYELLPARQRDVLGCIVLDAGSFYKQPKFGPCMKKTSCIGLVRICKDFGKEAVIVL